MLACLFGNSALVGHHLPEDEFTAAVSQINAAGFPTSIAYAQATKAMYMELEDSTAAIELYKRAIDMLAECGGRLIEQAIRSLLVGLLSRSEDPDPALASFVDIVNDWQICGDTLLAPGIGHLVALLARLGHNDGAARLCGAVTRGIELDAPVPGLDVTTATVRGALGDAAVSSAHDAGTALSYQAAGELARGLIQHARDQLQQSS